MNSEHRRPKATPPASQVRAICRKQAAWLWYPRGSTIWGKRLLIEECNRTAEAPTKPRDETLMNSRHLKAPMNIRSRGKTRFLCLSPLLSIFHYTITHFSNQMSRFSTRESILGHQLGVPQFNSILLHIASGPTGSVPQGCPSPTSDANHNSKLLLVLLAVGL